VDLVAKVDHLGINRFARVRAVLEVNDENAVHHGSTVTEAASGLN